MTAPAQDQDHAAVSGGPFGYMVARRHGRSTAVAELDGTAGWQVYHAGLIVADGLDQAAATNLLRTLPTPTRIQPDPKDIR